MPLRAWNGPSALRVRRSVRPAWWPRWQPQRGHDDDVKDRPIPGNLPRTRG